MSQITSDSVEKLKGWLRLPVEQDDDERADRKSDIEALSPRFGSLVFEDDRWYEYDDGRINGIMQRPGQEWLDDHQVSELESRTSGNDLGSFLSWFEPLLSDLESSEGGAAGPAVEDGAAGPAIEDGVVGQVLGLANPNYAIDPVPGTQFYKYDPTRGYLYADAEHAVDWLTLEERVEAARQAEVPPQDDGRQRGYPNPQATVPGTRYYTLLNDVYLYNDTEYGDDGHGWQPYEYWQQLQQPVAPVEAQPVAAQPVPAQPVEPQPVEPQPVEPQPVESQQSATTIDAAVEEAAATAFADLDADLLAGLDLSEDDIAGIADTVAAQIVSGMES